MVKIYAVIVDEMNILCVQMIEDDLLSSVCLPNVSADSIVEAKNKLKRELMTQGVSIVFDKELINSDNAYVFKTFLKHSFISNDEKSKYVWRPICEFVKLLSKDCNLASELNNYLNRFLMIENDLNKKITKTFEQRVTKMRVLFSTENVTVQSFNEKIFCPFLCSIDYEIIENEVKYLVRWKIMKQPDIGKNDDIVFLFLSTMATLLKFNGESVWISVNDKREITNGDIIFESYERQTITECEEFCDIIFSQIFYFNFMMGLHSMLFGSIDNRMCIENGSRIEAILSGFGEVNKIIRTETSCYLCDGIGYINIHNNYYDYELVVGNYEYEILEGISGVLILPKNDNGEFNSEDNNYIDYRVWEILQYLIDALSIRTYKIVVQSNILVLYTEEGIWFIGGNFHFIEAQKEREKIITRQERENRLLNLNRSFEWIYPIDATRFELLVSEILRYQFPAAIVRVCGNTNNADFGADIKITNRVENKKTTMICQCKAYKKNVNKADVPDIRDTLEYHNSDGYILAVASNITNPLMSHLEKLKDKFDVILWSGRDIFDKLKQYPRLINEFSDIINVVK